MKQRLNCVEARWIKIQSSKVLAALSWHVQ